MLRGTIEKTARTIETEKIRSKYQVQSADGEGGVSTTLVIIIALLPLSIFAQTTNSAPTTNNIVVAQTNKLTISRADYQAFIVSQIAQRNSLYATYEKQSMALFKLERERMELRLAPDQTIQPQIQRLNACMDILRRQTFELRQREFLTRN